MPPTICYFGTFLFQCYLISNLTLTTAKLPIIYLYILNINKNMQDFTNLSILHKADSCLFGDLLKTLM